MLWAIIVTKQIHTFPVTMTSLRDSYEVLNIPYGNIDIQMLLVMQLPPKSGMGTFFNGMNTQIKICLVL